LYIYFGRIIGYKIVFDITEDYSTITDYKSWWAKFRVKSSLYFNNILGSIADGVIVINAGLLEGIRMQKSKNTFIIKIPISIDPVEFSRSKYFRNHDIFYGGSFGEKDGLKYLLTAFEKVVKDYPDSRLVLSGIGSERDMKRFNSFLNETSCKNNIIYLGYLEREEYLYHLFNSAVHCVVRNDSNYAHGGFPFKLGEMLASGTPVIVTNVGEVERFLENNRNAIIIQPESAESIYVSILHLFNDRKDALRIGEEGRKLAFERFNLTNKSEEILAFFDAVSGINNFEQSSPN
jgi:glycosyltransferase involved in cell wall biosynthesis